MLFPVIHADCIRREQPAWFIEYRKLMVELMREVGFGIPVMPQGAFYVFADASRWTDDSYQFAFELLEKAGVGVPAKRVVGRAPGVDLARGGRGPGGSATHPARSGGTVRKIG